MVVAHAWGFGSFKLCAIAATRCRELFCKLVQPIRVFWRWRRGTCVDGYEEGSKTASSQEYSPGIPLPLSAIQVLGLGAAPTNSSAPLRQKQRPEHCLWQCRLLIQTFCMSTCFLLELMGYRWLPAFPGQHSEWCKLPQFSTPGGVELCSKKIVSQLWQACWQSCATEVEHLCLPLLTLEKPLFFLIPLSLV